VGSVGDNQYGNDKLTEDAVSLYESGCDASKSKGTIGMEGMGCVNGKRKGRLMERGRGGLWAGQIR
jgi:hypothetical protein